MMMRSVKTIISLTALVSTIEPISASNPECSAHPRCGNLEGDCCPTTDFRYLDCCERDSIPDAPAECSAHSNCASRGLAGACCPTIDGIFLYCCNDAISETRGSSDPTRPPTPARTPGPTPPPTTPAPTLAPVPGQTPPPTVSPTKAPTFPPTKSPTKAPTKSPTKAPTKPPTPVPQPGTTPPPTAATLAPTKAPTPPPTPPPTKNPTPPPTPPPTKPPTPPPTPPPTTAPPTPPPTPGPTSKELEFVGDEIWDYYELAECEGDCDFHSDCALGLVCGFRDFEGERPAVPNVSVNGCSLDPRDFGTGFEDFCHRPKRADTAVIVADQESGLGKAYPLGLCEADCYDDADCQGNLVCLYLEEDQEMRGCTGFGEGDYGYCVIP